MADSWLQRVFVVLTGMQLNRHAQYKLSRSYGVTISLIYIQDLNGCTINRRDSGRPS